MRFAWRLFVCPVCLITGCSISSIATAPAPDPRPSGMLTGMVHGGPPQNPISGAKVYLYAVTTGTTIGQASTDLLSPTGPDVHGTGHPYYVVTDSSGHFGIAKTDFSCGTSGPQLVYLYSSGGNPGLSGSPDNTGAGLMAALGTCTNSTFSPSLPSTGVQMNEVTTVAAAYALGGFAAGPASISGVQSGTTQGSTGLANAFAMAGQLASIATGEALAPGSNGAAVQQEINTLANSLATCVNSTSNTSTQCDQILPYAGNASDTAQAAINIVHTGGGSVSNAASIFSASTAFKQFSPYLSAAPNDWSLAITYTTGGLGGATDIAIDSTGSVYVTNSDNNTVTKYTPLGAVDSHSPFSGNGLGDPFGLAIDSSDQVWVGSWNTSEISGFTSTGATATNSPFSGNGINDPFWIAFDSSGNLWITNFGNNTISEFSSAGGALYNSPSGSGGLNGPDGVCIGNGIGADIWVTNPDGVSGITVSRFTYSGAPVSGGYTASGMVGPIKCAIDANGSIWTANYGGASSTSSGITEFRYISGAYTGTTFTGGGSNGTYGGSYAIAIDGAGHVWVANYGPGEASNTGSITELDNSGNAISGTNGFQPGLNKTNSIAIDGSGNVWVVNNGDPSVTELVGAATPVVTPLAVAAKTSKLGRAP